MRLALENDVVAVSDIEALVLLNEYGPATVEELAKHRSQPLSTPRLENTLRPLPKVRLENTLRPLPKVRLENTLRPLPKVRLENNTLGPPPTVRLENTVEPLPKVRLENAVELPQMPDLGEAMQRIEGVATLRAALHLLQHQRKAISVTIGRGKKRRTLWMTPQQGRELVAGIGRVPE